MKLNISILLLLLCLNSSLWAQSSSDDTISAVTKLWNAIEADTLSPTIPQNLFQWQIFNSKDKKNPPSSHTDSTRIKAVAHYIENLYLGKNEILNSLEKEYATHGWSNEIAGYIGLKDYISCLHKQDTHCSALLNSALSKLKNAQNHATVTAPAQWSWISKFISGSLPYDSFKERLKVFSLENTAPLLTSGSGAIISLSRKVGSQNILISENSKSPLKIMEWNTSIQKWKDITNMTGLQHFPGGNQYYIADINNDKAQDIIILRKSSSVNAPYPFFPSLLKNNGDGTFSDISKSLSLDNLKEIKSVCLEDIDNDGRQDLIFLDYHGTITLFLQQKEGVFSNVSKILPQKDIELSFHHIYLKDYNQDGKLDILFSTIENKIKIWEQKVDSNSHQIYFEAILPQKNTLENTFSIVYPHFLEENKLLSKYTDLPKELLIMEAGVWVRSFDNMTLLFSGGTNIEGLFPLFEYSLNNNHLKAAQLKEIPLYIHSIAVIEKKKQPYLLLKGGLDFHTLKEQSVLLEYRPEKEGKYHRIFDLSKEQIGTKINYTIIDNHNIEHSRSVIVQSNNSSISHAMQEWIWLPEGYFLSGTSKQTSSKPFTTSNKVENKGEFQSNPSSSPHHKNRDAENYSPHQEKLEKTKEPISSYPKMQEREREQNIPKSQKKN
ncbi:MAG: VCBS repeat-containing protein [Chitinophagales bacterium]|nr:VCBS repeat-containing protein [Chitinophagales bacterium]